MFIDIDRDAKNVREIGRIS